MKIDLSSTFAFLELVTWALKGKEYQMFWPKGQLISIWKQTGPQWVFLSNPPNVDFLATSNEVYISNLNELNLIKRDIKRLEFGMGTPVTQHEEATTFGTTAFTPQEPSRYNRYYLQASQSSTTCNNLQRKHDGALLKASIDRSSVCQRVKKWILKGLKWSAIERA